MWQVINEGRIVCIIIVELVCQFKSKHYPDEDGTLVSIFIFTAEERGSPLIPLYQMRQQDNEGVHFSHLWS